MTTVTLPATHASEGWRYAPKAAVEALWPIEAEEIVVPAGAEGALDIVLEDGAGDEARHLALDLGEGAEFSLTLVNVAAGARYARICVEARLAAKARLTIGAVALAGGSAQVEIVTEVTHAGPDAFSRQVIRQVAGGSGQVTYLGRVRVDVGADGTDGAQSVRAMLLSPTAQANARPELEIYADDVKCAHGCAVGELDRQALFYLAQRGLPPAQAQALMLQAFVAEALDGADEALAARVAGQLAALTEAAA